MAHGLSDWGSVDLYGVTVLGQAWRAGLVTDARIRAWGQSPDRWRRRLALVATVPLNSRARGGLGNVRKTLSVCRLLASDRDDGEKDVVVFLGDYIDRGHDSRGCIDAILAFRRESPAEVTCLRGNHEDWLLRTQKDYACHSWLLGMEGLDTVRSYSPEAERALREDVKEAGLRLYVDRYELAYDQFFDLLPEPHRAFFAALVLGFESPDCICTHAGLDPRVSKLADQTPESLVWGNAAFPAEYRGETAVVYGHWNNAELDAHEWPRPKNRW